MVLELKTFDSWMCNKFVNNSTMKWAVAIALTCAWGASCLPSDQSHCSDNSQCNVGYYCNLDLYTCSKCLRCEELKRAALPVVSSCVKSIAECGRCLPGLVADPSGNLDAPCVPADSVAGPDLAYLWITLAVVLLALALMAGALLYALRNTDTFKMVSFTRASLQSPCGQPGGAAGPLESAPPPYNMPAGYLPVGPSSPPPELALAPPELEDSSRPFIKRADSRRARAPRERASNQEAQVFNNPSYVRGPELPPSYDSTVNGDGSPAVVDDATMESLWTPADDANNNYGLSNVGGAAPEPGNAAELSSLLSEARGTTLVRPPERTDRDGATPSKLVCVRQDSNNNSDGRSRPEDDEGGVTPPALPALPAPPAAAAAAPPPAPHPPHPAPQLTELNLNITVQHNEFKLIRSPDHRLDCFL